MNWSSMVSTLPLLMLFVAGGCGTIGTVDPLQQAICNADVVEARAGWWKVRPDVLLREIPLGTPVEEARSIMERHGFSCQNAAREKYPRLICKGSVSTGWITATRIEITLYYDSGKIVNVEAVTTYEGP